MISHRNRKTLNSARIWLVAVILLVAIALPPEAQTERRYPDARDTENTLNRLLQTPEDPTWDDLLLGAIDTASGLPSALLLLEQLANELRSPQRLCRVHRHTAVLKRAAGDVAAAQQAFVQAYQLSGGDDLRSLLDAAIIMHDRGLDREAEAAARIVVSHAQEYPLKRRATILAASCMAAGGNREQAQRLMRTLADVDDARHVEPEGLFLLFQLEMEAGVSGADGMTLEQIRRLFPGGFLVQTLHGAGPESRIPPNVQLTPRLSAPALPGSPAEVPAATPVAAATGVGAPNADAVQLGSFTEQENAQHLRTDVEALGLRVEVLAPPDGEAPTYRVVVRQSQEQSIVEIIAVLEEAGFAGIPVTLP